MTERNELQIVTYKNCDPDILDHLFQKKCYLFWLVWLGCCFYLAFLFALSLQNYAQIVWQDKLNTDVIVLIVQSTTIRCHHFKKVS